MALLTFYATGTVSVLNGSTTVTGSGTGWGGDVILPGDLFMDPAQPDIPPQRIAAVTDATHLELAVGWPGTDMSADPYEIRFVGDIVRSTAQSRRYLEMLGQLSALGIQPNAFGEFADRDAYDDEAAGFIFLSLDGDGESGVWTLYIKKSAAAGDWDDGQTIAGAEGRQGEPGPPGEQGAVGPANTLTIGTVEGGPVADAEITGTAPNQTLNLVLPQGDAGEDGWSPVFAIATDGARRVLQLAGYVGGTGTEPTDHVGEYVGASGYTSTIGDAVDIRGPAGAAGAGSGDMQTSVYDPQGIEDDAFDRANHTGTQSADTITDGTTNKAFTATEKTKLGYISVTQAVDLDAIEAAVVPAGGTTGQVLKKASNADNDTVWADESGAGTAAEIAFSPTGNVPEDNVQDAIEGISDDVAAIEAGLASLPIAFRAYYATGANAPTTTMIFGTVAFNYGAGYDHTTGLFTVPADGDGLYMFNSSIRWATTVDGATYTLDLWVNGNRIASSYQVSDGTDLTQGSNVTALVPLVAGDQVKMGCTSSDGTQRFDGGQERYTYFQGVRLYTESLLGWAGP